MTHLLGNGLRNTYNKRDADSRLRVLYEKEVSLQTTETPSYLVIGIRVIGGYAGSGYTAGQRVTIGPQNEVEATVTAIDASGGITGLSWDESKVYPDNIGTINPGTVEADDNDVFDDTHDPHAPQSTKPLYYLVIPVNQGGAAARVRVVTRYAPGDYPAYGTLGHANRHDPLVQASYMTGYVDKKLDDAVIMRFVGYVSKYDPRWPWSLTKVGEDAPQVSQKPVNSPESVVPQTGDLWYSYDAGVDASPSSGTGAITPETAKPDTFFPWGVNLSSKDLFRWDGFRWVPRNALPETSEYANGYTPEKLDLWETLNVGAEKNNGADGQNTGFYWLDQWKLYTFSVDETLFMHLKGNETVNGQKTFTTHPLVPSTSAQVDTANTADTTKCIAIAQVTNSVLLLSGSNKGLSQTVSGTTTFNGNHALRGDTTIGSPSGTNLNHTTLTIQADVDTAFKNNLEVEGKAEFTSTTQSVEFSSDITLPVKSAAATENVTTHPASEHQVYLAVSEAETALTNHKTANPIDHPDGSVTEAKLASGAVTTGKIADGAITSTKITDEAITTAKLAPGAITSDVISTGSITSDKIADEAITGAKISGYNATHGGAFLRKDGTWVVPPDNNTTYSEMSGTTLGLVKLNGSYTFTSTINVPTPALS